MALFPLVLTFLWLTRFQRHFVVERTFLFSLHLFIPPCSPMEEECVLVCVDKQGHAGKCSITNALWWRTDGGRSTWTPVETNWLCLVQKERKGDFYFVCAVFLFGENSYEIWIHEGISQMFVMLLLLLLFFSFMFLLASQCILVLVVLCFLVAVMDRGSVGFPVHRPFFGLIFVWMDSVFCGVRNVEEAGGKKNFRKKVLMVVLWAGVRPPRCLRFTVSLRRKCFSTSNISITFSLKD